mgnify:CR=1 FL=1
MLKDFFKSQEDTIRTSYRLFLDRYEEEYGEESLERCDVELVWSEFMDQLDIDRDLNDCYNYINVVGAEDEFVILREFCACHDPAVDAGYELSQYIAYIKEHPEEFFRVFKQYEDNADRTKIRNSWGTPSASYFTNIVNGIPVPEYASVLFECKEDLVEYRNPSNRVKQGMLAAFPKDAGFYTTMFGRHIAAYHGAWKKELEQKTDSKYEPMRVLIDRLNSVKGRPTKAFAIGDRHGKVNCCLVPGCDSWSNPRLGTYVLAEEVKDLNTYSDKRDLALLLTVNKAEQKLKNESEARKQKRQNRIDNVREKRQKQKELEQKRFNVALRVLDDLDIDYIACNHAELITAVETRIYSVKLLKKHLTAVKNIKHYFSKKESTALLQLDLLIKKVTTDLARK